MKNESVLSSSTRIGVNCRAMFRAGIFIKDLCGSLIFDSKEERVNYANRFKTASRKCYFADAKQEKENDREEITRLKNLNLENKQEKIMKNLTGILAVLILLCAGLACSGDDTAKANETVGEANKFVATANESVIKAGAMFDEFETKVDSIKNDTGLEEAKKMARDLMPLYDSMNENFTKAGQKFDEASKLKLKEKHKEYLETKAKEMKLRGEYSAELKKIPQALIDSKGEKDYRDAASAIAEKVNKMTTEAKTLGEKATQIQKDNPDVMEQPK